MSFQAQPNLSWMLPPEVLCGQRLPKKPTQYLRTWPIPYNWPCERSYSIKPARVYGVDKVSSLKTQLASLTNALSKLSQGGQAQASPQSIASLAAMANQQEPSELEVANYVDRGQYQDQQ